MLLFPSLWDDNLIYYSIELCTCNLFTSLAQHRHHRGLGAPRCLRESRLMLVMMGTLVLHTIGTSRALVQADASTSIGPCLCVWGHLARTGSSPVGPWWAKVPRPVKTHARASRATCLAHHQHQRGLSAHGCLYQHQLMPCAVGGTWLSQHRNRRVLVC